MRIALGSHAIVINPDPAHWSPPAAVKWIVALGAAQWAQVPGGVVTLLKLMAADYASGMIVAAMTGELSSRKGLRGFGKKALIVLMVWALRHATRELDLRMDVTNWLVIPLCVNELISILENCARGGVPVPDRMLKFLLAAQKLGAVEATDQRASKL